MNLTSIATINLIDENWKWGHYDSYQWGSIPEADNPVDRNQTYLIQTDKSKWQFYSPINSYVEPTKKTPVLFTDFANLLPTQENFIKFSNIYGPPALPKSVSINGNKDSILTVTYDYLYNEHWLLSNSVKLWDDIQKGEHKSVLIDTNSQDERQPIFLVLTDNPNAYYVNIKKANLRSFADSLYILVDEKENLIALVTAFYLAKERIKSTNFYLHALLQKIINQQFEEHRINPFLQYDYTAKETNGYQQSFRPTSLFSLMWYQFYKVVSGESIIKQCPLCKQWSDVTKQKSTWKRHTECYETDKKSRLRKMPQINELLNQNINRNEIAVQLNIKIETLNRWLDDKK